MKTKNLLIIAFAIASNAAFAQWTTNGTNIYNTNTGNVGIGTLAPSQKLDVNGNIISSGGVGTLFGKASYNLAKDNRTIAPSNYARNTISMGFGSFNNNNTYPYADFIEFNTYADASGGNDNLLVILKDGFGMRLYQQPFNSTSPFMASTMPSTLYMDIPVVNPGVAEYKIPKILRSGGSLQLASSNITDNGNSVEITAQLIAKDNLTLKGTTNNFKINFGANSSPQHYIASWPDGSFVIGAGNDPRLRIKSNNITQIQGDLELKVDIGDWVFEKDYKLLTINEVENFIKQNGHLPGMISANDVKEKNEGMTKVNDFTSRLLVKIEELTLYVIDQNKKIEAQQKEIELLKNK